MSNARGGTVDIVSNRVERNIRRDFTSDLINFEKLALSVLPGLSLLTALCLNKSRMIQELTQS
jgi:hypothetical protein